MYYATGIDVYSTPVQNWSNASPPSNSSSGKSWWETLVGGVSDTIQTLRPGGNSGSAPAPRPQPPVIVASSDDQMPKWIAPVGIGVAALVLVVLATSK